ncbi:MAG: flagellar basal body P-ring protein FlgI [Planctomycetota bacterium]
MRSFMIAIAVSLLAPGLLVAQEPIDAPAPPASATSPVPEGPGGSSAAGVRLVDLVDIEGVRENHIEGVGVVVGLRGTGDSSSAGRQAIANLVTKFKLRIDPSQLTAGNAALVRASAVLPPFVKPGQKIDVSVQSILDAESLFGGELVRTLLYGPDGEWYAAAQGPLSIGGFEASGQAASVTQNHPSAGRVPGGATVEKVVPMPPFTAKREIELYLKEPGFVTAQRTVAALESLFPGQAQAIDAGTIVVAVPPDRESDVVGFVAELSDLHVVPYQKARVVINEKTGTVVVGDGVTLREVCISHGNLTVRIAEQPMVSQPLPYTKGQTTVVPRTQVEAEVDAGHLVTLPATVTVKDLAEALNALGVTPRDLVTIFQMLHRHGSLNAELVLL